MTKPVCPLYSFLHAAKGDWRNSIFIECGICPHGKPMCPGFLLTMDSEGRPLLVPVEEFSKITGQAVQKDECLSVLRGSDFKALYSLWLAWQTESAKKCAILQLLRQAGSEFGIECSGCSRQQF